MNLHPVKQLAWVAKWVVLPSLIYFLLFCLLTYPLITKFSTHLFADQGDGFQNVWNIWWVNEAVTELRQSPWHTDHIHYPFGTSLLGHTLTPFNGFMSIPLLQVLSLQEAHNFMFIFSFVGGGLMAFVLAYHLTKSFWPSIIAGSIFTFCSYHFAHAEGHLNLISIEWIPAFILLWYLLMLRPGVWTAVGAALVLFLVLLCEYYFFFHCVLAGLIIFCWNAYRMRDYAFFLKKAYLVPLTAFCLTALATSGAVILPLMRSNWRDPLLGYHNPEDYCMDVFTPVIYGGHWRFADLTERFWSRLPGNIHESSVYLGLSVIFLLIYVWRKRRQMNAEGLGLWFLILLFFVAMSMGPRLYVYGARIPYTSKIMPYTWLVTIFPPLKVSGVPVRMMVIATLGAAVICAWGFKRLFAVSAGGRFVAAGLLLLMVIEYLPKPVPASPITIPNYVRVLRDLPPGGVLDTVGWSDSGEIEDLVKFSSAKRADWVAGNSRQLLLYQTVHHKPVAFGFMARIATSLFSKDLELFEVMKTDGFPLLWPEYRFRYLSIRTDAVPAHAKALSCARQIYRDEEVSLFDLTDRSPAFRSVSVPVAPANTNRMTWKDGVGYGTGGESYVDFTWSQPRRASAVRLTYDYENRSPGTRAAFRMSWRRPGGHFADRTADLALELASGWSDRTVVGWVNDTIDGLRIFPDGDPFAFKLSEIVLLVPADEKGDSTPKRVQASDDDRVPGLPVTWWEVTPWAGW
jgi:hypothetical protein